MITWPPIKKVPEHKRRVTLLGQDIRIVRPERIKSQIVYKNDRPVIQYDKRPRTRQLGCAEFFKICMTHEMVREDLGYEAKQHTVCKKG